MYVYSLYMYIFAKELTSVKEAYIYDTGRPVGFRR